MQYVYWCTNPWARQPQSSWNSINQPCHPCQVHPCDSCKNKNGKGGNLLSQILHADFGSPKHCNWWHATDMLHSWSAMRQVLFESVVLDICLAQRVDCVTCLTCLSFGYHSLCHLADLSQVRLHCHQSHGGSWTLLGTWVVRCCTKVHELTAGEPMYWSSTNNVDVVSHPAATLSSKCQ